MKVHDRRTSNQTCLCYLKKGNTFLLDGVLYILTGLDREMTRCCNLEDGEIVLFNSQRSVFQVNAHVEIDS